MYLRVSLSTRGAFARAAERLSWATRGYISYEGTSDVLARRAISSSLELRMEGEVEVRLWDIAWMIIVRFWSMSWRRFSVWRKLVKLWSAFDCTLALLS